MGEVVTAANMNAQVRDNLSLLGTPPNVLARCAATYVITTGAWQAHPMDAEDWDTDTMHDTVTTNTRVTCRTAGKYLFAAGCTIAVSVAGAQRGWGFRKNGAGGTAPDRGKIMIAPQAGTGMSMLIATQYNLVVNDYVELIVYQDSGGNLNSTVAEGLPFIAAAWQGF